MTVTLEQIREAAKERASARLYVDGLGQLNVARLTHDERQESSANYAVAMAKFMAADAKLSRLQRLFASQDT